MEVGARLATDAARWAVPARCERGFTRQLPDLAVWLKPSEPPVAVIAESGGRREDRQKLILEGWRDGILSGRYAAIRYDCSTECVAHWIGGLARNVGSRFNASRRRTDDRGRDRRPPPAAANVDELPVLKPEFSAESAQPRDEHVQIALVRAPPAAPVQMTLPEPPPEPQPETPEEAAERERRYREIFGPDEPERRRRWRR